MKINPDILQKAETLSREELIKAYAPPKTLGNPHKDCLLAQDSAFAENGYYDLLQAAMADALMVGGGVPSFLGYATLSNLAQNGLIRAGVGAIADEMTRNWMEIKYKGEHEGESRIDALNDLCEKYALQRIFNRAASHLGFFGGCLAFIDFGDTDSVALKTPLVLKRGLCNRKKFKGFKLIEPINIYPGVYNADNPLREDYFTPQTWWVLGKEVHRSRFLYFTANELPLLLKPAYNFFGISEAQIALDSVANFTRNRESASRLLNKFSLTCFKTNMSSILNKQGSEDLDMRMAYFVQKQDNDGIMCIDKDAEDIAKLDTNLGGVDVLVRQALEFVAAMFRIPVVKFLGISPGGMNATGEADLKNWWQHCESLQSKRLTEPLKRALEVLQYVGFGQVDSALKFEWVPLEEDDNKLEAEVRQINATADSAYVSLGVLGAEDVRERLSKDKGSGYEGIKADDIPIDPILPSEENLEVHI